VKVGNSTMYVITNNIIHHNATASTTLSGVSITDTGSTGTFAFDTVAANGSGAGGIEGGISCPNATTPILNSIVTLNAHNPATNGTQFFGKCQLQSVVTGQDSFTGAIQSVPAFVSASDFHLDVSATGKAANQACCTDKITGATTANANHDVDRGPRPKPPSTALDIGAHEAL
jgi:hypothetical protein